MVRASMLVLVVACRQGGAPSASTTPADVAGTGPSPPSAPAIPRPGPSTHVVVLTPATPTAIVRGPFRVTAINPGVELALAITTSASCTGAIWFSYSGGGVAIGAGDILCARSRAAEPTAHGFSGVSEPPPAGS